MLGQKAFVRGLTGFVMLAGAGAVKAGKADVIDVDVDCDQSLLCDFAVSVRHADNGWGHYANRWEVVSLEGQVLATRVLAHPHDNEQPFTRSLRNVQLPPATTEVIIRAHDSVHKLGGKEIRQAIPQE